MKLKQISVFLENKTGRLSSVCDVLGTGNFNIRTLTLADTEQFGILRLVVREWEKAKELLEGKGYAVKVTDVVAVEIDDEPGGLERILKIVDAEGIDIDYMYAFSVRKHTKAVMIFRFEETDKAIEILQRDGINILAGVELFDFA